MEIPYSLNRIGDRSKSKLELLEEMVERSGEHPHGWSGEANVNLLTDIHCREPIMGYPQMKSQLCSIRKA